MPALERARRVHDAGHDPDAGLAHRRRHVYFCIARTVRSDRGGYHVPHTVQAIGMGCEVRYARELVYADGIDLEEPDAARRSA